MPRFGARSAVRDARDPDAYYVLSLAARHRGQRLRAHEALRHCLRLASSYAPAHGLLAQSCVRSGRVDEARAHCDRAFELSPLEPLRVIWHSVRAEASLMQDDPQAAVDEAQRGMAVNPGFAQLYVFGVAASLRAGAAAQAREWVGVLLEHKAFQSLSAVRTTMQATFDPALLGHFERLIEALREAELPE